MDAARAVLDRLSRLEALDRERARPETLIPELERLVDEAEEWARIEGGEPARRAVAQLRSALAD